MNWMGNIVLACAFGDYIYKSTDWGGTYSAISVETQGYQYWKSICCDYTGINIVACSTNYPSNGGYLWTSNDTGGTWTRRLSINYWIIVRCNLNGQIIIAGDISNKRISLDYGNSWKVYGGAGNGICCDSTGGIIAAGDANGPISTGVLYYPNINTSITYQYNGSSLGVATSANDTSCNSLTNYTINGTVAKFLKPFYDGTDKDAVTDLSANASMFKYLGNQIEFCPAYYLHGNTCKNFTIPSGVTKMFVVCIGGGGGGGGGGVRGQTKKGGGGGGGGGGALNSWFVTFVSGQTTYNVTIGGGGLYGQPNSSGLVNGVAEGAEDGSGTSSSGRDGDDGENTTFTYNSVNYISNGGKGGKGGIGGDTATGTGNGGAGGVVSTTPTPIYASLAGSNGVTGNFRNDNDSSQPGGVGGESGNRRGTSQRFLINNSHINVQPFTPYTFINTYTTSYATGSGVTSINNTYNHDRIYYGDGGRGGVGEAGGWGSGGYSGLHGCVIVFFYY